MELPGFEITAWLLIRPGWSLARARRRSDNRPVLLKRPHLATFALFESELKVLRMLCTTGVPRPLGLVSDGAHTWLVLEDAGLEPLTSAAATSPRLPLFFACGRVIAHVLAMLHRRELVLGSLDPDALLVDADGSAAEIVDFSSVRAAGTAMPIPAIVTPYTAPESTGRTEREPDYRADFYAAGATLYEVLTGTRPFSFNEPLELAHAHIARTPPAPATLDSRIPQPVSQLVMKLLSKSPDERYQSGHGLAHDLDRCVRAWTATGAVPHFPLGERDLPDAFRIPSVLYGRDRQRARLLESFDRVAHGGTEVVLISGDAGAGKTSLVRELMQPIAQQGGYFCPGKSDQIVRDIPYGALAQALRAAVAQLLADSESRLTDVREALRRTLGPNGAVLAGIVPEIELVVGSQPPAHDLDTAEAQNRFRYVLQQFVATMAGQGRPLAIVLDDLQWSDAATLDVIQALVTAPRISHLLVVGAYRSNEIGAGHPLTAFVDAVRRSSTGVQQLTLDALRRTDLSQLLRDTLRGGIDSLDALATLIEEKTDGNPFFVIQFLTSLRQEGLLELDPERACWSVDLARMAQAGITDNVVELMTWKIRRLSPEGQRAVTIASCIGSRFDGQTYEAVNVADEGAARGLAEALDAGLVQMVTTPMEGAGAARYAFLHDRVQQAAYELIPPARRLPLHLEIGRLLLTRYGEVVPDDRLFELANHLSIGGALMTEESERVALAKLCLAAARRAKRSAAFTSAHSYIATALGALPGAAWHSLYELALDVHLEVAECHYLTGRFADAEALFERVREHAATPHDAARIYSLRIVLYENLSRWPEALATGREGLVLLGIVFPDDDAEKDALLAREVELAEHDRGGRAIASLADLPVMTDAAVRLAMRILTSLWASAYISGDHRLARLISVRMVRLSLAHGNAEDSAYGYVTHAITVGPVGHDYRAAYEWGALALEVNARLADSRLRAKVHQQFQAHVNLWRRPFETCLPHAREARRSGLEAGDFTYAAYGAVTESWPAFLICRDLGGFVRTYAPVLGLLDTIEMRGFRVPLQVMLGWALALQGRTAAPGSLTTPEYGFDEEGFASDEAAASPFFMMLVRTARLHLAYMFGAYGPAVRISCEARDVAQVGTIWPVLIEAWGGLAMAAAWNDATDEERGRWRPLLLRAAGVLEPLAEHCPENFRCLHLLLCAEIDRTESRLTAASVRLDQARAYARTTNSLQHEALACELTARLELQRNSATGAAAAIEESRRAYRAYGAFAKAAQLESRYAAWLTPIPAAVRPQPGGDLARESLPGAPESELDMTTVLKVAHAVAAEIETDGLLRKLMTLALESAHAQRGAFLDVRGDGLYVAAEASVEGGQPVIGSGVALESAAVAGGIVRYVRRTGRSVVVGDATEDSRFAGDPYIQRHRPRSVLCVPVEQQGRIRGILYLENNLAPFSFTPGRIELMRVLSAQAAISLENARLYEAMRTEVARRSEAEHALRAALAEVEALKNRLEAENVYLQEEIRTQHNFEEIVGNSPPLLEALRKVERVAPTDATVLIAGETGSGKELFARAVHSRSTRKGRPLVKVNCGAIAPGLVESELFGHVKGAFTGAVDKRIGRFELADGGTIFLDEVGELPLEAQVKLLRVLQEQEFEPVGSSRTIRVSVRVIAATNRDLEVAAREGRFRADLLYRLNVFPIDVPPLRARGADIALLAGFFVSRAARRIGKPLQGFNARSMERLLAYSWPGNVRELQNLVERSAILAEGPLLTLEGTFLAGEPAAATVRPSSPVVDGGTLDDVQREHIVRVLKSTGGVVEGPRGAATILGMHPNTLRSRIRKLGIVLQ